MRFLREAKNRIQNFKSDVFHFRMEPACILNVTRTCISCI